MNKLLSIKAQRERQTDRQIIIRHYSPWSDRDAHWVLRHQNGIIMRMITKGIFRCQKGLHNRLIPELSLNWGAEGCQHRRSREQGLRVRSSRGCVWRISSVLIIWHGVMETRIRGRMLRPQRSSRTEELGLILWAMAAIRQFKHRNAMVIFFIL